MVFFLQWAYNQIMKRIQIITGASAGLGREFARQLPAFRSADEIWLLARRADQLRETAALLPVGKTRVIPIDLGGDSGVSAFTALLKAEPDTFIIDTLINNAGFGTYGSFAETALDRQLAMIDLNVYTLTALCYCAIPYMERDSLIINVASLAAFIPLGNLAVYAATKAYVLSFSTALGSELADSGIFVSTVCPGPVDTEFSAVASGGARKKVVGGKDPVKVVAHCYASIKKGQRLALMAPSWRFKALMSRFVGRYAYARHSYLHDTRPAAPPSAVQHSAKPPNA